MSCSIPSLAAHFGGPQMVWVIIGCTVLIIVCLGGGMRLAQIILGAIAIFGAAAIFLGSAPPAEELNISGSVSRSGIAAVAFVIVFFALMAYRQRQGPP